MLGKLAPGDVVTVTRIDRLARSTFDLFAIVKRIADAKAQFRSLAEPWADTGTSTGRLMLAVLGGLADVERDLIRTRTAEGRSRVKAQGKHMGRPPSLTPAQQKRGDQTARAGRDARRTRPQLQCKPRLRFQGLQPNDAPQPLRFIRAHPLQVHYQGTASVIFGADPRNI
jgi:DNA invertase Pin-like site-specific DNA recombinase